MISRLMLGVAIVAISGAFLAGVRMGTSTEQRRSLERQNELLRQVMDNAEKASRLEAERLAAQAERDEAIRRLDEEAREDPDADNLGINPSSVLRLQGR